jgi:hypothetical protein
MLEEPGQLGETVALLKITVQRMKQIHWNKHPPMRTASRDLARLSAYTTSVQKPEGRSSSKKRSSLSAQIKGNIPQEGRCGVAVGLQTASFTKVLRMYVLSKAVHENPQYGCRDVTFLCNEVVWLVP